MSFRFNLIRPLLLCLSLNIGLSSSRIVLRLRSDSQCPMPGYFRDETDCRKFYRCAEHPTEVIGQSIISKAEFNCPAGTIYDESLSSCNHISFVRDIPPGCNVSSPDPGSGSMMIDNSDSSSSMPSMMPQPESPSSPGNQPMQQPPQSSNPDNMSPPPLMPLIPPGNLPQLPIMPGDQPPELPIIPDGNPENQFPLPVFPGIMPGNQGEQQQPPNIPGLPIMLGNDGQPIFPPIPGFPGLGGQDQLTQGRPPAISVPVMQGGQQQHHQQLQQPSFPNLHVPSVPGAQNLPNNFPFNFNMFSGNFQHPTLSLSKIPGISSMPGNNLQNQQINMQNLSEVQNTILSQSQNQNQDSSQSQIAISVPVQNLNSGSGSMSETGPGVTSWINPQKFNENQNHNHNQNQATSNMNMLNNQGNPSSWVVPNNFPMFYSYSLLGGRTPLLLSGRQVSNPGTYVII